jgi:hypothetical protein
MAMQDNTVLPGATDAAGGDSPLHHFLNLLMGGGLHGFGGFGGQPFGGFGHFLMNNPGLMRGLGLMPPGAAPMEDSGPVGAAAASSLPNIPGSPTSLLSTSETPGILKATRENPAADLATGGIQPALAAFRTAVNPPGSPEYAPPAGGAPSMLDALRGLFAGRQPVEALGPTGAPPLPGPLGGAFPQPPGSPPIFGGGPTPPPMLRRG